MALFFPKQNIKMEIHQLTVEVGFNQIVSLFKQLNKSEKFKIFEHFENEIIEYISQDGSNPEIAESQKKELQNRMALIERGEMKLYDWDKIKSKYAL